MTSPLDITPWNDLLVVFGIMIALYVVKLVAQEFKELLALRKGPVVSDKPRKGCVPSDVNLREMERQLADLHEWHSATDADGVRLWYIRRSVYTMFEKIQQSQDLLAQLLQQLVIITQDLKRDSETARRALERIEENNPDVR